jgi:transcriptional regulator with XRE-family HTH domain
MEGGAMTKLSVGTLLKEARAAHGLSQQEVAQHAGCSAGYVHKLEADRVRTPSPRVLAGLAEALALSYGDLMQAAGYDQLEASPPAPRLPGAVKRYSNAHIVELLEQLQGDIREIKTLLAPSK